MPGVELPTTPLRIVQVAQLVPALVKPGVRVEAARLLLPCFARCGRRITSPVAMAVLRSTGSRAA